MVNGSDGWAHLVTESAYEQGLREHTGHYAVLCGLRIPAASMARPTGPSLRALPRAGVPRLTGGVHAREQDLRVTLQPPEHAVGFRTQRGDFFYREFGKDATALGSSTRPFSADGAWATDVRSAPRPAGCGGPRHRPATARRKQRRPAGSAPGWARRTLRPSPKRSPHQHRRSYSSAVSVRAQPP
jgi:hypothetical protein